MPDGASLETPSQFVEFWFGNVLWRGDWLEAMRQCTESMRSTFAGKYVDQCLEEGRLSNEEAFGVAGAMVDCDVSHPAWPAFTFFWVRNFRLEAQGYELAFREGFAAEVPEPHVMVCPVDDITLPVWMVVVRVGDGPPRIDGFDDVTGRRIE